MGSPRRPLLLLVFPLSALLFIYIDKVSRHVEVFLCPRPDIVRKPITIWRSGIKRVEEPANEHRIVHAEVGVIQRAMFELLRSERKVPVQENALQEVAAFALNDLF
ncbi:hypothetical protein ACVIGB_006376 [Bradyrhizobium sp. USDA 4341]